MVQTRRSIGMAQSKDSVIGDRAVDSIELTAPSSLSKAKRRSGRASLHNSGLSSRDSVASAVASANSISGSGYSTPLTSNVSTPVLANALVSRKPGEKMEINIPMQSLPADGKKMLSKSIYNLNGTSKRKWDEVDDSDEDLSDASPDAKLARQLQQEEDDRHIASLKTPRVSRRSAQSATYGSSATITSSAKGKAPATGRSAKTSAVSRRQSIRKASIESLDGHDDEVQEHAELSSREPSPDNFVADSEDDSDAELSSPPSSDVESPESSDSSSEDDTSPASSSSRRRQRGKAAQVGRRVLQSVSKPAPSASKRPQQRKASQVGRTARYSVTRPPPRHTRGRTRISTTPSDTDSSDSESSLSSVDSQDEDEDPPRPTTSRARFQRGRQAIRRRPGGTREERDRFKLETNHPYMKTLWEDFEAIAAVEPAMAQQPTTISRSLKPFQLQGLAWMKEMEKTDWKGGLLGDEMGLGKTIQAVSLVMSDWPAKHPSLVLAPPVALMQWMSEIQSYTDGTLKTMVYHGSNSQTKHITMAELKKLDVIIMSYNSLESLYRKQEKGFNRKDGIYKEKSMIHQLQFHRVILDEAHYIKTRTTMTSKACFALKTQYRWCLTGTPLQNRIGEFFSLIRFLKIEPFANYLCRECPCSSLEWTMNDNHVCSKCKHGGLRHVSVFNQELLNPIQKYGKTLLGAEAFRKLRLLTSKIMLRRQKKDHMDAMELPIKEVYIDRQFFGEEEKDFANSIMHNNQRRFDTYVAQGVVLNNYANIFGLLSQMRQVADHPDLILRKENEAGRNVMVCCICDDAAEDAILSNCKHEFCRLCVSSYVNSTLEPKCPRCHIMLTIDLEQPEIEQDQELVKKNSIINRIRMEQWTSSTKMEMLVHALQKLRSDNSSHKSIVFSQFTGMLQLIEWRLRRAGITTVMLDGSMTPVQRAASINHFMTNVDVECFLVSLKAGGVALNLTEASRVFIVDPWWNPAAEWQSADRVHRIGQTRPVVITRLCIEDSIESRIVLLQEKKTKMINSTVNADDVALDSLEPEDLQFLFRGN